MFTVFNQKKRKEEGKKKKKRKYSVFPELVIQTSSTYLLIYKHSI